MRAVEKLLTTKRLLTHVSRDFAPVAFFQTFSMKDIVLADLIYADLVHREYDNIKMFTIDTGKLPDDHYRLLEQIRQRYGDVIKVYYPYASELEQLDARFAGHGDYGEQSNEVRLLKPLQRALSQHNGWISSHDLLEQNLNASSWIAWDHHHQIPRFNPLSRWTRDEVLSYSKHHNLPVHSYLLNVPDRLRSAQSGLWWWQTDAPGTWNSRQHIA
ncbi:phosphoadenosine phosphosulfate reductase domain-containing protein [Kaarinaea lacus]